MIRTMFSRFQRSFGKSKMCFIRCPDNNQLNVWIREHIFYGPIYFHGHSKSLMNPTACGLGIAFQDRVKSEKLGQGKDERHMEGETGKPSACLRLKTS
jgi:hypothetical protein